METAVAVALISSGSSLAVAVATAIRTARENAKARALQETLADKQQASSAALEQLKHTLQMEAELDERRREQLSELGRYRKPLVDAAHDLERRIDNIRHQGFLFYLREQDRRAPALLSTLYRFGRYFGTLEIIYARVNFLEFERAAETRAVADQITEIGRTFASDEYDRTDNDFATSRLMVWREEQRGIGEKMVYPADHGSDRCVGYATFVDDFEPRYAKWFTVLTRDLELPDAVKSERLAALQERLAILVRTLDDEGRFS